MPVFAQEHPEHPKKKEEAKKAEHPEHPKKGGKEVSTAEISAGIKKHIGSETKKSKDKKFHVIVATYTVLTPAGELLGRMRKNYLYNVFRKKWDVFGAHGEKIAVAREDSLILSLLRRFLGPFFGILRTNFVILTPGEDGQERVRGEFNRKFTLFDRYVLDVSRDRPRTIDRRLAVALGVLLDTGEHR